MAQTQSSPTSLRQLAVQDSMKVARGIFALRGNHSEVHLSEADLAAQLALAFEHGFRAAILMLHKTTKEAVSDAREGEQSRQTNISGILQGMSSSAGAFC